jgi:antitoxin CptB
MSGTTRSSADLDPRRRKVLFRSWHRGIREMDLIMGRFADAEIGTLTETELDDFERLIEVPDRDLFRWITGESPLPVNYDTTVYRRLKSFHSHEAPIHGAPISGAPLHG